MNMDLNDIRSAVTLISFVVFALIVAWAWRAGRGGGFDAAAQLPLIDDSHSSTDSGDDTRGARR